MSLVQVERNQANGSRKWRQSPSLSRASPALVVAEQRVQEVLQVRLAGQVVRGHELQRLVREEAHAVELAAVREHLREAHEVPRRAHLPMEGDGR